MVKTMINVENAESKIKDMSQVHMKYIMSTSKVRLNKMLKNRTYHYLNGKRLVENKDVKFLKKLFGSTNSESYEKFYFFCLNSNFLAINKEFSKTYRDVYKGNFFKNIRVRNKMKSAHTKRVIMQINYILGYDKFNDGVKKGKNHKNSWNRHIYISRLSLKICPYCNRNYITNYVDGTSNKTTADADHYYIKSLYPVLQLNLYNLIPCCSVCNSNMKSSSDKRHLHPFFDSMDSLSFSLNYDDIPALFNYDESEIDIKVVDTCNNIKTKNSIDIFKLDKVYQIHSDVIFELKEKISLSLLFDDDYYEKAFGIDDPILNLDNNFGKYWFDFLNKPYGSEPLNKLKTDIYNQIMSDIGT